MISKEQEQIDRLEKKVEELQKECAVLKYYMEKESFSETLIKIFVNNVSQQMPQFIKIIKDMETATKQE